jgi:hypothetical protein
MSQLMAADIGRHSSPHAAVRIEGDQFAGATRQPRRALNRRISHYFSVFESVIGARADS